MFGRHDRGIWGVGVRGAGPSAGPPASAAVGPPGDEDEEGMDEPPEVRQFMQELGAGGGSGANGGLEPGPPEEGLPTGGQLPQECMWSES